MRIVLVGPFPPLRGGISMFNHSLAETLSNNHEVHRISFSLQYPQLLFPGKTQFFDFEGKQSKAMINSINPFSWKKTVKFINSQKQTLSFSNIGCHFSHRRLHPLPKG